MSGLAATLVEAPYDMQENLIVPENHYDVCRAGDTPFQGNAAGNTEDAYNLDGQIKSVAPLPAGFTARGIVALVFSCVSAFLGMAMIAWYVSPYRCSAIASEIVLTVCDTRYGAAPLGSAEVASAKKFIAKAGGTTA